MSTKTFWEKHSSIIIVSIITAIVLIVGACLWKKDNKIKESFLDVVENFPQLAPMNVMYSDTNGNLGTTTDLGVQYLTVAGDSSIGKSLIVNSRNILNELDSIKAELASTKADLSSTKTVLSNTNADLAATKTDLASTKDDLSSTKTTLSNTNADLSSTKTTLSNTNADLAFTKTNLTTNYIKNQDNINLYYPIGNADVGYDMYLGSCNGASCGGGWQASFGRSLPANSDNFKIRVKKI